MKRYFTGIDEAALGPILGPYCVSSVCFEKSNDLELFDIFKYFNDVKVCDSKKLYCSGKSIENLELSALSFVSIFLKRQVTDALSLIEQLLIDKNELKRLLSLPWYSELEKIELPLKNSRENLKSITEKLKTFMKKNDLTVHKLDVNILSAQSFNLLLNSGFNKSECCQQAINPLILKSILHNSRLMIDRQGGRRYYGEWLVELFPKTDLSIINESKNRSSYSLFDTELHFQVKCDDLYFETALASIISKYTRELLMISFNDYWCKQNLSLKKTAGYPQDGKRFIADLDSLKLPYDKEKLIRKK